MKTWYFFAAVTVLTAVLVTCVVLRKSTAKSNEVVPTEADVAREKGIVAIRKMGAKGFGVVATVDIPAWTLIGPYPGKIYSSEQYDLQKAAGRCQEEYAIEFWDRLPDGTFDYNYLLDPAVSKVLDPKYTCAAPFVNEPDSSRPNLVWVWNLPKHRTEYWTSRLIPAGTELTICYGQVYTRKYTTSCTTPGKEPVRYVIATPEQRRPRKWEDVMPADK